MNKPICKCGTPMGKAGKVFSGTRKVQRYKCSQCGRTWTDTKP